MPKMDYLHLNNNQLRGSIPPILSIKESFRDLMLHNNLLEGTIPESLSMLTGLGTLKLNNNRLEGTIPESLSMLTGLETLNLGHNTIDGKIPSTLRRLTNLQLLHLQNNLLSGTIQVLDQGYLRDIDLSVNYLTMGSLEAVPLSIFSIYAHYWTIVLKSNCLVYRNPSNTTQNVNGTHCRGERVLPNRCS